MSKLPPPDIYDRKDSRNIGMKNNDKDISNVATPSESDIRIGVVGLGYVGLPMACLFASRYATVGYDIDNEKILNLQNDECGSEEAHGCDIAGVLASGNMTFTSDPSLLKDCNFIIVSVPTPIDNNYKPDISILLSATKTIGKLLSKGVTVVYESTVYPGMTEELCVPLLERESGLRFNEDFFVGFSPERINVNDHEHTVEKITKVTSGSTPEAADRIDRLYASVLENGTFKARNIKTAEACKIIENCQRDVLIALFNEFRVMLDPIGVDIRDVSAAASTKWNFVSASPGLVGGHCIAVDPYYMISKAESLGVRSPLLHAAREVNEEMPRWLASEFDKALVGEGCRPEESEVLILGFSFKPDCADIRNTKVADLFGSLRERGYRVTVYDPVVDPVEVKAEYGIDVSTDASVLRPSVYKAIVIGTSHSEFNSIDKVSLISGTGFIGDVYGLNKVKNEK